MSENTYGTIITAKGSNIIADCILSGKKLTVTEAAAGDGNGAYYVPTVDQTALKNEKWRGDIASAELSALSPNMIDVKVVIPDDIGGFTIREMALFDNEGTMIAVCNTPDIQKVTISGGMSGKLTMLIHVIVADTSVVEFTITPTLDTVTREELEAAIAGHNADTDSHPSIEAALADTNNRIVALAGEIGPAIEEVLESQKGKANGIASLGSSGTIPTSQIPILPSAKLPTIPVSKGGTGKTSWSSNRLIYPSSSAALSQLAFPKTSGSFLRQGTGGAPYWTAPEDVREAIDAVPNTRTINGKPLSEDTTLTAEDVDALPSSGGQISGNVRIMTDGAYPQISVQSTDESDDRIGIFEHSVDGRTVYFYNKSALSSNYTQLALYPEDTELRNLVRLLKRVDDGTSYYMMYGTHNVTVADSTPTEFVGEGAIVFCKSNHSIYRGINGANVRFY